MAVFANAVKFSQASEIKMCGNYSMCKMTIFIKILLTQTHGLFAEK